MMKLVGDEMRKFEYVVDVFKGTCELNNFEGIKVPSIDEDGCVCKDIVSEAMAIETKDTSKIYFYGIQEGEEEMFVLGALADVKSTYSIVEMINMTVKFLMNLNVEEVTVEVNGKDSEFIQETLEVVNIPVSLGKEETTTFIVYVGEEKVAFGGLGGALSDKVFMEMNYDAFADMVEYKHKQAPIDVYVAPTMEEVLDDAFIIGTDLRDAGLKVEVDYSLKQVTSENVNASLLITFDKEDIAKYQVKLIDMGTKEIKTVMIDNLIEELAFI